MSEFWLWFIRPIAEVLGVLALIALLVCIGALFIWLTKPKGRRP